MTKKSCACQSAQFQTVIGICTISWNDNGICRFTISAAGNCTVVPLKIKTIISRIQKHFEGEFDSFADLKLDLSGTSSFQKLVYKCLRKVPAGKVISYGELAKKIGAKGAARAVGTAMATNPIPIIIPCHRVICADGKIGAYSGGKGIETKKELLKIEKYLS